MVFDPNNQAGSRGQLSKAIQHFQKAKEAHPPSAATISSAPAIGKKAMASSVARNDSVATHTSASGIEENSDFDDLESEDKVVKNDQGDSLSSDSGFESDQFDGARLPRLFGDSRGQSLSLDETAQGNAAASAVRMRLALMKLAKKAWLPKVVPGARDPGFVGNHPRVKIKITAPTPPPKEPRKRQFGQNPVVKALGRMLRRAFHSESRSEITQKVWNGSGYHRVMLSSPSK